MRIQSSIASFFLVGSLCAASGQSANAFFQRGRSAFEAHDDTGEAMRDAETDFRRALQVNPRHSASIAYLGMIAAERGERKDSETLYRRALEFDPKCAEALVGLARISTQDGRKDQAQALSREAVRARPENRLALRELATVLTSDSFPQSNENLREAMRCWQALIRLDGDDRDAHYDLARAYRLLGSWADAEREYRRVLRIGQRPDDGDVWIYSVHGDIAEMLEKQGKLSQAIAEWSALAAYEYAGDEELRTARERIAELSKALKTRQRSR